MKAVESAFKTCGYRQNGHVKVKWDRTPFDGDFVYWSKRNSKYYDGFRAALLKKQGYRCAKCGLAFVGDEAIELHHKDRNRQNWKAANLVMLHQSCHDHAHAKNAKPIS